MAPRARSDEASALAVATNGGLVIATAGGRDLAVGIRPANRLGYSPVLMTSDAGESWSPAAPVAALAEQPDALATDEGDQALALTVNGRGGALLASSRGLASWHTLTTASELGSSPAGRSCGLVSMTAVAYGAGLALLGTSCRRAGVVGVYADSDGTWRPVGPELPAPIDRGSVDVLGLENTTKGLCAILAVADGDDTSLLAAWRGAAGGAWRLSPVLELGSEVVRSFGPYGGSGLFVLPSGSAGSGSVEVVSGPGAAWRRLPTPPARTETMVFGLAGRVDALAVDDTTFTDWTLPRGSHRWARAQVVDVPIEFGSSG